MLYWNFDYSTLMKGDIIYGTCFSAATHHPKSKKVSVIVVGVAVQTHIGTGGYILKDS